MSQSPASAERRTPFSSASKSEIPKTEISAGALLSSVAESPASSEVSWSFVPVTVISSGRASSSASSGKEFSCVSSGEAVFSVSSGRTVSSVSS